MKLHIYIFKIKYSLVKHKFGYRVKLTTCIIDSFQMRNMSDGECQDIYFLWETNPYKFS